ncbi:MAG TPA: IPT/TIG domain-containing protein [Acidimicrobiales bacterium]
MEQTSDAGQTWKTLDSPQLDIAFSTPFIDCPDADHCVAVGGPEQIPGGTAHAIYTSDGGETWKNSIVSTTGDDPSGLWCVSDDRCLVTEEGNDTTNSQVDITTDGGATWTASPKIEPNGPGITAAAFGLSHIVCPSATECVAVAEEDYFTDTPPVPVEVAYDTFASSTDGGMTWHQMALPTGGGAVACPSSTHCLMASDQAVESLTTTDGGASWTITNEPVPGLDYSFSDISCPTTMECVAVQFFPSSNADAIYTSNDEGSTWDSQPIATAFKATDIELDSVSCPSPTSCWTVGSVPSSTGAGDGSIILHSLSGGVAWPSMSSISPAQGPVGGGTVLTISGAGFFGSPIVTFGSGPGTEAATNVIVLSPTELKATVPPCDCTPPPPEGLAVPVTVTISGLGLSPPNLNYEFTYLDS